MTVAWQRLPAKLLAAVIHSWAAASRCPLVVLESFPKKRKGFIRADPNASASKPDCWPLQIAGGRSK